MSRDRLYPPSVTPGKPILGKKPEGWIETSFGDMLIEVKRPAAIKDAEEYQLVTAKRSRGGIVPRERLTGEKIITKTQFYIKSDDFLISKRQIIHGACGVVPSELDGAIVSGEYSVLRVQPGLLLEYLNFFSHTIYFQQTCFQSSVGVDVEKMIFDLKEWMHYKIYLPSIPEQIKIIEILGIWDRAVKLTKQLIEDKMRLKKGLIHNLLAGKKRFPEFEKNSEEQTPPIKLDFPKDWEVGEFGLFVVKADQKFNPTRNFRNYLCIELEHVEQETGRIIGHTFSEQQKSIKTIFRSGDVLFGKLRPYLRKFAHPNYDGVCSSEIWVLSGRENKCDNDFLFYLVQTDKFIQKANVSSGTKMPRSDWDIASEAVYGFPSIPEQKKITSVLTLCDKEIDLLYKKLNALISQKKGLMLKLLTGQTRVKI